MVSITLTEHNYWHGLKKNIPDGAVFGMNYLKIRQRLLFRVLFIACL